MRKSHTTTLLQNQTLLVSIELSIGGRPRHAALRATYTSGATGSTTLVPEFISSPAGVPPATPWLYISWPGLWQFSTRWTLQLFRSTTLRRWSYRPKGCLHLCGDRGRVQPQQCLSFPDLRRLERCLQPESLDPQPDRDFPRSKRRQAPSRPLERQGQGRYADGPPGP